MQYVIQKSYVQAHERKLKSGKVVQILAHYDKRTKKHTEHAPEHGHDDSHLSGDEKDLFSRMHREQHFMAHYHATGYRKMASHHESRASELEAEAVEHEKSGRKKRASKLRDSAAKHREKSAKYHDAAGKMDKIVQGIGALKEKLVAGSGKLAEEDTDAAHARYAEKAGHKFKTLAPKQAAPSAKPTESGHAEGDKWVMPLKAAVEEHKELVHAAETPTKADDKAQLVEQKAELARMESNSSPLSEAQRKSIEQSNSAWEAWKSGVETPSRAAFREQARSGKLDHLYALAEEDKRRINAETEQRQAEAKQRQKAKNDAWRERNLPRLAAAKKVSEDFERGQQAAKVAAAKARLDAEQAKKVAAEQARLEAMRAKTGTTKTTAPKRTLPKTGRVSNDDPSIWGSWLLGHEGESWSSVRTLAPAHLQDGSAIKEREQSAPSVVVRKEVADEIQAKNQASQQVAPKDAGASFGTPYRSFQEWYEDADMPERLPDGRWIDLETGLVYQGEKVSEAPKSWVEKNRERRRAETLRVMEKINDQKRKELNAAPLADLKNKIQKDAEFRDGRIARIGYGAHSAEYVQQVLVVAELGKELLSEIESAGDAGPRTNAAKTIKEKYLQYQELLKESDREQNKAWDKAKALGILKDAPAKPMVENKQPASMNDSPREGERNAEGLVFRNGRWHREEEATKTGGVNDDLSDDPNSPNYRFKDTGYVAGSRKEMAANMIRRAARSGTRVNVNEVDWASIEENPREAKELITKSNLFGQVPWETLKEGGMEPGAGFVIDRVYASIGKEPSENSPQARKDYALGLQTLRERLEKCKTPADVSSVLNELVDEYLGTVLSADESVKYSALQHEISAIGANYRELENGTDKAYERLRAVESEAYSVQKEVDKRVGRGWKVPDEMRQAANAAKQKADAARAEFSAMRAELNPKLDSLREKQIAIRKKMKAITEVASARNKIENPLYRAWSLMGDKFVGVLKHRYSGGSSSFLNHMVSATNGRIKDWSWAEKDGETRAPRMTKEEVRFQLKVADKYERVGGRVVSPDSTLALKNAFNLRDVQSGNWVLRDTVSAKFHVENTAKAFADLADIFGVPDEYVSLNGRLAMAFGARGTGSKNAPKAHYEPVQRVINLTKMGGGGSLAHEWAHALDNIVKEAVTGEAGTKDDFASENPEILPAGELREAFKAVRSAMLDGNVQASETLAYEGKDVATADHNVNSMRPVALKIKAAGSADAAVRAVDSYFASRNQTPKTKRVIKDWRRMAVAFYDRNPDGAEVKVKAGPMMSAFAAGAADLDGSGKTPYWSTPHEMFARAFQSYVEDRLESEGRKNDYLSAYADNKYHVDPLFGVEWKPYPEGEERIKINKAFDRLVNAIRDGGTLAKAASMFAALPKPRWIVRVRS